MADSTRAENEMVKDIELANAFNTAPKVHAEVYTDPNNRRRRYVLLIATQGGFTCEARMSPEEAQELIEQLRAALAAITQTAAAEAY